MCDGSNGRSTSRGTPVTVACLIATIGVAIGFGELPYGYYMLLRLFLCGVSLFVIAGANLALADWEKWLLGGFAVLYIRSCRFASVIKTFGRC